MSQKVYNLKELKQKDFDFNPNRSSDRHDVPHMDQ